VIFIDTGPVRNGVFPVLHMYFCAACLSKSSYSMNLSGIYISHRFSFLDHLTEAALALLIGTPLIVTLKIGERILPLISILRFLIEFLSVSSVSFFVLFTQGLSVRSVFLIYIFAPLN